MGWDKDDVWFAHCCMLDDAETKQWADDGVGIAHCPSSNMRLASGIAPVSYSRHTVYISILPFCMQTSTCINHRLEHSGKLRVAGRRGWGELGGRRA